jgi:hypothetical protein
MPDEPTFVKNWKIKQKTSEDKIPDIVENFGEEDINCNFVPK